jgi:hypothetical protein
MLSGEPARVGFEKGRGDFDRGVVMRLNGWQRLWVICAASWGALVFSIGFAAMPPPLPAIGEEVKAQDWFATNAPRAAEPQTQKPQDPFAPYVVPKPPDLDANWRPITNRIYEIQLPDGRVFELDGPRAPTLGELRSMQVRGVFAGQPQPPTKDYEALAKEHGGRVAEPLRIVSSEPLILPEPVRMDWSDRFPRTAHLLTFATIWGIPSVGIYLLGLGIAWVRRGFAGT